MSKRQNELNLWQPFRELERLTDSLFRGLGSGVFDLPEVFEHAPAYGLEEVKETDGNYVISVPLPGVEPDDIKVSLGDSVLRIDAEGRYEKEDSHDKGGIKYHTRSLASTDYHRQWRLPAGVGEITSTYRNGVLEVTVPKPEEDKREVEYIDIKVD